MEWGAFISRIADHKLSTTWREAFVSVVTSSLPNALDVDNSQVILSSDDKHVYRLILTTSTTYYNGNREFNLYLVEALQRSDYGNKDTTMLLKGLELVCRFRFMFLEEASEFSKLTVLASNLIRLPDVARALLQELNFLRRDSQSAGLDQPNVWSKFVRWESVLEMSRAWEPQEKRIRDIANGILRRRHEGNHDQQERDRNELADAIDLLGQSIKAHNCNLIKAMTAKLQILVDAAASRLQPGDD